MDAGEFTRVLSVSVCVCAHVSVCVCAHVHMCESEWERERERDGRLNWTDISDRKCLFSARWLASTIYEKT